MLRGSVMRVIADIYLCADHLLRSQAVHCQILQARVSQVLHRLCASPKRRVVALLACAAMAAPLVAERAPAAGPGDRAVRIGNSMPPSAPAAAYRIIDKPMSL